MSMTSEQRDRGRSLKPVYALSISALCVVLLAGHAWGQGKPTSQDPKGAVKPSSPVQPAPKTDSGARVQPQAAPKNPPQALSQPQRGNTLTMNPDAKWACDQQTVALEPVWRGDQSLTFAFDIRNEGTADLKIKAKGG